MVMPSEEKWFHNVIEHVLLTELQQPVFPIKYRWFNKMNRVCFSATTSSSKHKGENVLQSGEIAQLWCLASGDRNKGRPSPPTLDGRGALCWHLGLAGDQGERTWLSQLRPVWKWWWNWTWTLWKLAGTFWKMMWSVGFWMESSAADTVVLTLGWWGYWVLWLFSINTKIRWPN